MDYQRGRGLWCHSHASQAVREVACRNRGSRKSRGFAHTANRDQAQTRPPECEEIKPTLQGGFLFETI